jgi:hypothetical protein
MAHQRLHAAKAFGQCEYSGGAQLNYIHIRTLELKETAPPKPHLTFGKFDQDVRTVGKIYLSIARLSKKFRNGSCILSAAWSALNAT